MTDRKKFRLWTRALASTGLVAIATIAATPASAACVSVLGVTIQTDLLGNTCINGGQTGPASTNGTAIGAGATVLGADGIAIGVGAQSTSDGAIVLGDGSSVTGIDGLAIGAGANVLGDRGVGLGLGALVGGIDGVAIGNGARSDGFRGIAIGADALSLLEADLAIGRFSRAGAPGDPFGSNTAFGDGAVASGGFASAFGANSSAVGLNTVAVGAASNASAPGSVALGAGATATTPDSVAIGRNAVAAGADLTAGVVAPATAGPVTGVAFDNTAGVNAGAVSVGAAGDARQVRNVADGTTATDAVNVRQLSGVVAQTNGALNALDGRVTANTTAIAGLDARTTANEGAIAGLQGQIATGTVGLVQQNPTTRGITVAAATDGADVNVAGTAGTRTISGVTAGSAPDQATNAAQLAAVISTFGPGATLNPDGSVTIPAYAVQGTAQGTVGGAIGALDTGLTDVRTQVAAINRTADGMYVEVNTQAPQAVAGGTNSVAIGGGAAANASNSVALGSGSVADRGPQTAYVAPYVATPQNSVGEISVGAPGAERQITNVAAGSAATDAVNVAQLQGGLATTVRYDTLPSGGTNYNSVTLGNGSGAVALRNIAPGTVGTDAVNLDQLRSVSFDLRNDMQSYRTDAQRGTAVALAATGMRFDDRPGRTSVGGAVSVFRGETGVAMGIGHTSSNQRLRYNAAVSFSPNGGSNVGAVAGATFSFGGD